MDLNSSAQEASAILNENEFGNSALHEHDHHYGKSSHAFRTISEVSDEIDVPQHVLRFWESKFAQIRPLKRGGGRRYYRPEDIELLKRIKNYLYKQGYTIKGVQRLLKEKRSEAVASFAPYASPIASLPGYPFDKALQEVSPLSISSYLQAAAAAPSALAMAYGAIGGQIAEHAGRHHFDDAFEQSTTAINNLGVDE
ncbi:MAG: MerR family transcriptional regulator, partial [Alphaproteobacteria bacterium]|nr:MerR family transcriptional regulator [Alphaproteobacteria bacterium]